ncbi:MAG: fibronectin type III domain-containing protein, partial [Candidatus Methanoperedens sp.]|nr:fibronectin type III domain-containing protein [Candidatus Methanoperedens sp.]
MTSRQSAGLLSAFLAAGVCYPRAAGDQPVFGPQTPDAGPVSFLSATSAVLNYRTTTPVPTRVQVRVGTLPASTPGQEQAWQDVQIIEGESERALQHSVTLAGLDPAKRYYYRYFDPDAKADPAGVWSAEPPWSREYAFATLAPAGQTSFLRIPVKVLLVPNVINLDTVAPDAAQPEPMGPEELELYRDNFRQAALFYWVNSRMRYWIDYDFSVEPEWQRLGDERADLPEFYRGWKPARDGLRVFDPADVPNHDAQAPLKDKRIWTGQVVVICERQWDKRGSRWFCQGSGGGTFGIDWMLWDDKTQVPAPGRSTFLGGSDIAWLMCHEFHHQKESQYAFSGLTTEFDRVVFDHFAPKYRSPYDAWAWDTAFAHGEHWDGIAWELRTLTDAQYFRDIFGEIVTAKDTDGDGIPDDDPRLPLDEKRLGSGPTKAMTDGVNHDMGKVMMAKWVPAVLANLRDRTYNPGYAPLWRRSSGKDLPVEAGAAGYAYPKLNATDSDGDGIPDKDDPYPIYPWQPVIRQAEIKVDGDLSDWQDVPPIGQVKSASAQEGLGQSHPLAVAFGKRGDQFVPHFPQAAGGH